MSVHKLPDLARDQGEGGRMAGRREGVNKGKKEGMKEEKEGEKEFQEVGKEGKTGETDYGKGEA